MRALVLAASFCAACVDMTPAPPGPVVARTYRVVTSYGDNDCGKAFWPVGDDEIDFISKPDGRYDIRKHDRHAFGWPVDFADVFVAAGGRVDHEETWSYAYQGPPWPKTAVGIVAPDALDLEIVLGWETDAFQPCAQHARVHGPAE